MGKGWCCLRYRYGEEVGAPTREDISSAVDQLYKDDLPGMTEGDLEEHGSASLRVGLDEGPMYILEMTRHGRARWEEWADQDYEEELCPMREVRSLSRENAILLWNQLAAGETDAVRAFFQAN